jgi:predicted aspartyl protease
MRAGLWVNVGWVAVTALALATGCTGNREATATHPVETAIATETSPESTTEEKPRASRVPLRVVSGPGGVFAFANVFIRGRGPYAFTVDTGASHSVIDYDVVQKLRLKTIGKPVTVTGITCRGQAGRLRMRKWRAGGVALPAGEIQTIDMPEPGGGIEIDGLLGSDVLSTFGAITVDYHGQRLLLGAKA